MKAPVPSYNHGLLQVCRERDRRSSFSARRTPEGMEDLEVLCTLAYGERSRRVQDAEYAQRMDFRLDRKVSTRRPHGIAIDTQCSAVIGDTLYHISDLDITDTELYFYLTEVKRFAGSDQSGAGGD